MINKLTTDLNIIQGLDDEPNDVTGLTAAQLKAKFDEAPNNIKDYINALVDTLNSIIAGQSGAENIGSAPIAGIDGATVYDQIKNMLAVAQAAQAGTILPGVVTDAMLSDAADQIKARFASSLAENTTFENNTNSSISGINIKLTDYNSYASSVDSNGIYTVIDYKRSDGTLYMKSTLSGGTSPSYTTDTWQFYDTAGTTVIATKTWTITYDTNGKITSKVVA